MVDQVVMLQNVIDGDFLEPISKEYMEVTSPLNGKTFAKVALSGKEDVELAISAAEHAFATWSSLTIKSRCSTLLKFYNVLQSHANDLAELIVKENGKTMGEALASVAKGLETFEWACGISHVYQGHYLKVSRGVTCRDERRPVGIVASIVPFNFPAMVPFWTIPIALACGNCVIVKPSEKCPLTLHKIIHDFAAEAGLPKGILQIVNGAKDAVEAIVSHPKIAAVTFVGSSKVAEIVYKSVTNQGKRALCLGGAKNHLIALPDCDLEMSASDIVSSFSGCAGQRCMAASVLIIVGENQKLIDEIVALTKCITPGSGKGNMGPVIDEMSKQRILGFIEETEKANGAKVLLDGRTPGWMNKEGSWIGPTILLHGNANDRAMKEEIFGPVLSIYIAKDEEEAIAIENRNEHGNAACIYTSNGGKADWFTDRFRAGMIGVNIGIPVPREPFSFGGLYGTKSAFGAGDITGESLMEFFSCRIKVTTKWSQFVVHDPSQFK